MKKTYFKYLPVVIIQVFLMLFAVSCKKDNKNDTAPASTTPTNFAKLGLYEQISGTSRRIFVAITQVGTQTINYGSVFDTGSTGMTIDANGLIPASMITATGITVADDSVNVNGITVTKQQVTIAYGGVGNTIKVYGNLAYAPVTIGDPNGNITTPRIPIFLYYKVVNTTTNTQLAAHSADVFGVGPGVSFTSGSIASPLSYFKLASGITNGFRIGLLNNSSFSTNTATYVPALLFIGLTPADLNSSNFIMHPLTYSSSSGYSPNIASTITYNGQSIPGTILFDTGTPSTTIIEDPSATASTLPANTTVSITTGSGFSYQYTTTATYNLTTVQNPKTSSDQRTIFSIDFFLSNEYLLDYTNHRIGLKNN